MRLGTRVMPALLLSMTVAGGCTPRPTAEEAGRLLSKQRTNIASVPTFVCRDGEKQWDYICQVTHQPTPMSIRQGVKPSADRVGVLIYGSYRGEPQFSTSSIPGDGPIPSLDEYPAWSRRRTAEAERKWEEKQRAARAR